MKNSILLLFALGLSFSLFSQSNRNGISYQGSNGGNGTTSSLSIENNIVFSLIGGTGGTGVSKPNGSGAVAGSAGASGYETKTSHYDSSPLIILSSSIVNGETPFLNIKF